MNFFLREGKTGAPGEEPVGARAVTGTRDSVEPTKNSTQMKRRRAAFTNAPLPLLNLIYSFVRFKFELRLDTYDSGTMLVALQRNLCFINEV